MIEPRNSAKCRKVEKLVNLVEGNKNIFMFVFENILQLIRIKIRQGSSILLPITYLKFAKEIDEKQSF